MSSSNISRNRESSSNLVMSYSEFLQSISTLCKQTPLMIFLGAGASITSNIPTAQSCVWDWKETIFRANNTDELTSNQDNIPRPSIRSNENYQKTVQDWCDRQVGFPKAGSKEEYSFYIEKCFPSPQDRDYYFEEIIGSSNPSIGYHFLSLMAQKNFIDSVWTTNFDQLTARVIGEYNITPYEVGIDTRRRLEQLNLGKGKLLIVSLHGDFRYDHLKNTDYELQSLEKEFHEPLKNSLKTKPIIVIGYEGNDESIMTVFRYAYSNSHKGRLYWCGYNRKYPSDRLTSLIKLAKQNGIYASYISTTGFDNVFRDLVNLTCTDKENINKINAKFRTENTNDCETSSRVNTSFPQNSRSLWSNICNWLKYIWK